MSDIKQLSSATAILLIAFGVYPAPSLAQAGTSNELVVSTSVELSSIEQGTPVLNVIESVGREPDHITEIGAACGMLEILTWEKEDLRIIANDGSVSAVVKPFGNDVQ